MLPEQIRNKIERIAADNIHGATLLTGQAAGVFALLAETAIPEEELRGLLVEASLALIAAQPSMASILRLANDALLATERCKGLPALRRQLAQFVVSARERIELSASCVAQHGSDLVQDGAVVMTHSHSTAVEQVLRRARDLGRRFRVLATESRPLCEGLTLARALAGAGIQVALVADAAVYRWMAETTVVMVGADAISKLGMVNKIGTSLVALAARRQGKPLFAVCGTDKFLGPEMPQPADRPRPETELVPEPPAGVDALNFYFDITPLDLVTGFLTENGVLSADAVLNRLSQLRAHPALLKLQDQMS